jgi:hypothetical protein
VKFGLFYEFQLPRPWLPDSEYRLYQDGLAQIEQPACERGTMFEILAHLGDAITDFRWRGLLMHSDHSLTS